MTVWPLHATSLPNHQILKHLAKATPNKFPVSRPELGQIYMLAEGSFPLSHYRIDALKKAKTQEYFPINSIFHINS